MEIIIQTGFAKVTHDILFQSETVPKGKALVKANHVLDVQEYRKNGQSYMIQVQVIRQTSVASQPYSTKLYIDATRKITSASCTCVSNQSGKCKHIAALVEYVNSEESLPKTDYEQQWGKPTVRQYVQEKYSKGKYFSEMFSPKVKSNVIPCAIGISELKKPSHLKTVLLEAQKEKKDKEAEFIKCLMDCMLKTVDIMLEQEEYLNTFSKLWEKKPVYPKRQTAQQDVKDFYDKSIIMSRRDIIQLCCDTYEQSKSSKWFEARGLRKSASKNAHSIKSRIKKSVQSLVTEMLFPKKVDTASTRYGTNNEPTAAAEYDKLFSVKFGRMGLMVSEKQPWLCASLDGVVVGQDNSIAEIVEFKCPSSYLHFKEDTVKLRESAPYNTQCQIQMYITHR